MEERRRNKRMELEGKLVVKRLDQGESGNINIEILDVSKTGVGFACTEVLELGAVYETFLTIWTKEVIHTFIEVVRGEKMENGYNYGSVFIGMPEIDAKRIEVYQTVEEYR